MSALLHLLAPLLSVLVMWAIFAKSGDGIKVRPMGWALLLGIAVVFLVLLSLLHITLGQESVTEVLFLLGITCGVFSVFFAASLFNSRSIAEKLASFVVISGPIKWLANEQRGFFKVHLIAVVIFMGLAQASWITWNVINSPRIEGDFLFCPDVWESPFRWIFELGNFGAIVVTLAALFARSLAEFTAEFVGRGHQRALNKLSLAFAIYGAICFLLERYYPGSFLDLLGHTTTISSCPNYYPT